MTLQATQTAQQRIMVAPNVALALEVLRMPLLELQVFLQQQVEDNPLLDVDDLPREDLAPAPSLLDEDAPEDFAFEQRLASAESLYDSLRAQLGCQPLSEEQRRIGEALILRLDESGYLGEPIGEIAEALGVSRDAVEAALAVMQQFEPAGVGARDLRECLMLQAERLKARGGLAHRILKDHFELFVRRDPGAIAHATGSPLPTVEEACTWLRRLNPRPGRSLTGELPPAVVPDLLIVRRDGREEVELNDQIMPRLTLNRTYARMLSDPATPPDAQAFLARKFRHATWLLKAIEERNATLLAIGRCLLSLQREFLEQGPRALTPLTQADVAGFVGRHPSTVSRAIAGKSIDAPCGVVPLERFFASRVPQTDTAARVSDARIKSELERLISEEDGGSPLSDEALAHRLLTRFRVSVARRTIAKYRASLKILPARLRRRL